MGRAAKNKGCKAGTLDAAQVAGAAVAIAEAVAKAAAQAAEPAAGSAAGCDAVGDTVCEGCGLRLAEGQWQLTLLDTGRRCHFDCWSNTESLSLPAGALYGKSEAGHIYAPADRVMATLPAGDLQAMGHDLKEVRRELNCVKNHEQQLRDETVNLKNELAAACAERDKETVLYIAACGERNSVCRERDMAKAELDAAVEDRDSMVAEADGVVARAAERQRKLEQTIDELKQDFAREREQLRFLTGKTVDKLNQEQRTHLRAELQAALDGVDAWEAAEEAVAKENPDLCCPLSLQTQLMLDPVFTLEDGRTYERASIEKHFDRLQREKQPLMSPQKLPLKSRQLVPNVMAKTHIVAVVQKKLVALHEAKIAAWQLQKEQEQAAAAAAAAAAKRPREA